MLESDPRSPRVSPVHAGILALAKHQGVDCIHPGYGFLSENATFARRCEEEGIAFIGPRAETIEVLNVTYTPSMYYVI